MPLLPPPPPPTDERTRAGWTAMAMKGFSLPILGSQDVRRGFGLGLGYGRPEPRFALNRRVPAQFVGELRLAGTTRTGAVQGPGASVFDAGIAGYARWRGPLGRDRVGLYVDLGIGLDFADQATPDLPLRVNFTPLVGFGAAFPIGGGREGLVGLRLIHFSNANLAGAGPGANRGQNLLTLTLGARF